MPRKINGLSALNNLQTSISQVSRRNTNVYTGIKITADIDDSALKSIRKKFPEALEKAHRAALVIVAEELELALGVAMEAKVWNWDYGDGDIVQTGQLRDSLAVTVQGDRIAVAYRGEYAAIVYYGGYINPYGNPNVQIYMPARPWVDAVINGNGPVGKFNFEAIYSNHFIQVLRSELTSLGAI